MVTPASAGPLVIMGSTVMVPAVVPSVWPEQALTQRASATATRLAVRVTGLPSSRVPTCHRAVESVIFIRSTIGWFHNTREPEVRQDQRACRHEDRPQADARR